MAKPDKILIALITCIVLAGFNACDQKQETTNIKISSFNELKKIFANPPVEYKSFPLWNWNGKITKEEIDKQLKEFKDAGIGGGFVHPRPGLVNAYLSEEWFELFKYSVEKGKELGLKIWIYDENSYPSGFAGGHVPAEMPESYNEGIALMPEIQDVLKPDTTKDYKVILKNDHGKFIDITGNIEQEKGKSGKYYLYHILYPYKGPWFGGYSYVDLLHKGVTEKFIEVTMNGYEKYTGEALGKAVPGVFTDEPNIARGSSHNALRWTPELFETFSEQWGYDLKTKLPMLTERIGEWKKVRHNYYQVLLQMFIDRWSKPWHEYCEANGLIWTGHYWEHGWPSAEHGGDNMAMYAWHQQPGIDMLGNEFEEKELRTQFGNIRSVKELRSAANQTGRKRTLSETYGGGGWEMTFRDYKYLGDWQYVLGVNFLNQHKSDFTLTGVRKYDYPPSFSYHEPWFEHYKLLGDYFTRLSVALSAGKQINKTLIIEPTTTAWMYQEYIPTNTWRSEMPDELKKIGRSFQHFLLKLERSQYEYDLGSENIIKDRGKVDDKHFIVGKCKYNLVVLPPGTENLDRTTVELIIQYLENGGLVISFIKNINYIDGAVTDEINTIQEKYSKQWHLCKSTVNTEFQKLMKPEDFQVLVPGTLDGKLYHHRRIFDDGQLIFFANSSKKESASGEIIVKGKDLVSLDPLSGKIYHYPSNPSGDNLHSTINLPPTGSLILFATDFKVKSAKDVPELIETKILDQHVTKKIYRTKPNVLGIDYLDATFGQTTLKDVYFYDAMDSLFRFHGFDYGNPWFHAIQYKNNIVKRDTFTKNTNFIVNYQFKVDAKFDKEAINHLQLVVEKPEIWDVFINDEKVNAIPEKWYIDRSFAVYTIGNHVKKGLNDICLKAHKMSVHADIQPVYVLGDFYVVPMKKGFKISKALPLDIGSWAKQGLSWYPGEVVYEKKFNDISKDKLYKLRMGKWNGSMAEILVNGKHAGIIAWEPYELDITKHLDESDNTIQVKIYSTLRNVFGPKHKENRGFSSPWDWIDAPEHEPAGYEYDAVDYGLFSEFYLVEYMKHP